MEEDHKRGRGRPRKGPGVINWLRLESRINKAYDKLAEAAEAARKVPTSMEIADLMVCLREISDAVGEETGRGYPLEKVGI